MQGSFGEAREAFRGGKKKDSYNAQENRKERAFRDSRRNRHADA